MTRPFRQMLPKAPVVQSERMIKGITIVRPAGTPEAYAKLASFFSALGFEAGRGWEEELSRGVSFLAPLGNLEFADGIAPFPAEIMVEVTGLEAVQAVARDWMIRNWGEQEAAHRLSAVNETALEDPPVYRGTGARPLHRLLGVGRSP